MSFMASRFFVSYSPLYIVINIVELSNTTIIYNYIHTMKILMSFLIDPCLKSLLFYQVNSDPILIYESKFNMLYLFWGHYFINVSIEQLLKTCYIMSHLHFF